MCSLLFLGGVDCSWQAQSLSADAESSSVLLISGGTERHVNVCAPVERPEVNIRCLLSLLPMLLL